jgi:hypothetical protein
MAHRRGVKRLAPSDARPWVTAVSPDGQTELFLGDPNIPWFSLPNPAIGLREGSQVPGMHGEAMTVGAYRPGVAYAALYGARARVRLRKRPGPRHAAAAGCRG